MKKLLKIALVGEPNVGKSTLINRIVGSKISIVTPKVQTTREIVRGIVNIQETQLIFIDTPGLFSPKKTLEKFIIKNAMQGIAEADISCLIIDSKTQLPDISLIKKLGRCIAVINKIDKTNKLELLEKIQQLSQIGIFEKIFLISAIKNDGIEDVLNYFTEIADQSEWIYPEDEFTDVTAKKLAEEITREKLFLLLNKELPYSLKVVTEKWEEQKDGSIKIYQALVVDKTSHKSIILGSSGNKIKLVSQRARRSIESALDQKVHLFLYVKIKEGWIEKDFS